MTIELFTGFVGSGKSYCATKMGVQVAESRFSDTYVIANFPIKQQKKRFLKIRKLFNKNLDEYKPLRWIYKNNEELTVEFLVKTSIEKKFMDKESSCLIIFDEASIPFNSRNWNDKSRLKWIEFLTQSRKFGYDFIFITQDSGMIDKQIRALCEYEVQHKKLNNVYYFKFLNLFRVSLFGAIRYWNGQRFSKGTLQLHLFKKGIAERYDTMKLFNFKNDNDNE